MKLDYITLIDGHNSTKHDSSVAIWQNGKIYALAAERVDRIKHSMDAFPAYQFLIKKRSIDLKYKYCFNYFSPEYTPFQEIDHHLAHAASAYYASPYNEAAILVVDGMGPYRNNLYASTSLWHGVNHKINLLKIIAEPYPCYRSIGHFYSAISWYLGFNFFDSSHTMSIAAYGDPRKFYPKISSLIWNTDELFQTDPEFIKFSLYNKFSNAFTNPPSTEWMQDKQKKYSLVLGPPRSDNEELKQIHYDIAAATQTKTEDILAKIIRKLYSLTNTDNLCYSGGVALNCVANGRIINNSPFKNVFIQPASDDTGQALGKVLYRLNNDFRQPEKKIWKMHDAFLGPGYSNKEFNIAINNSSNHNFEFKSFKSKEIPGIAAELITKGNVIGWFQGRSEFGPRALGHRSILADARKLQSVKRIDECFKRREWYRPFSPSLLRDFAFDYTSKAVVDDFMLRAVKIDSKFRKLTPAVIHIDGRARVQKVVSINNIYYDLLKEIERRTGLPVVLNTSLNLPGQPIVETPDDALLSFHNSNLGYLILGNFLIWKK